MLHGGQHLPRPVTVRQGHTPSGFKHTAARGYYLAVLGSEAQGGSLVLRSSWRLRGRGTCDKVQKPVAQFQALESFRVTAQVEVLGG